MGIYFRYGFRHYVLCGLGLGSWWFTSCACLLVWIGSRGAFLGVDFCLTKRSVNIPENKPTPPYTYGLGKVDTASGNEHTTRQSRTEVKPDGARKIRWGERGGGSGPLRLREAPFGGCGGWWQGRQGRSHKEACVCPMIGHGVGGGSVEWTVR